MNTQIRSGHMSINTIPEDVLQELGEKEVMIDAFDKVRKLFECRTWIMEGRGSYPYNDDRYKEEVRYLYDEFDYLQKEVWSKIKTKTFEYREKIIANFKSVETKQGEEVMQWVKASERKPETGLTVYWRRNSYRHLGFYNGKGAFVAENGASYLSSPEIEWLDEHVQDNRISALTEQLKKNEVEMPLKQYAEEIYKKAKDGVIKRKIWNYLDLGAKWQKRKDNAVIKKLKAEILSLKKKLPKTSRS